MVIYPFGMLAVAQIQTSTELTNLQMKILGQFRVIYGSVKQHFREVEKKCGVSGSQIWLLREVAANPGVGVSELARCLSIHQSTCSILVEKLVLAGSLSKARSAEDQRRVGLQISAHGRSILRRAPGPAEGVLPDALKSLSTIVLHRLDADLTELIGHLPSCSTTDAKKPLADL